MNKKTILFIVSLTCALLLGRAQTGFAASTVSVLPAGNGVFSLQGALEGVGAMDITLTYDTSSLANPRVENGGLISGALTAVNLNIPGTVRMAIIRTSPMQGSGVIATLAFDRRGSSPGKITALSARLSNTDGRPLPSQVQVVNPTDTGGTPSGQTAQEEQKQDGSTPSTPATAVPVVPSPPGQLGIVVVPGAPGEGTDVSSGSTTTEEQQEQAETPERVKEPVDLARKTDGDTAGMPESQIHKQKSVLERFREYAGKRTAKAYLSLFEQDGAIGFRQEPAVVIADGKAAVKVVFISDRETRDSSDLAIMGASLVSLKRDPDYTNTWIAELKPAKDAYQASMTMSLRKLTMVFPLAVAPPRDIDLDKSGKVNESDFALFLTKRGTQKAPAFDLNNDGKRDYIDEYIFTANYLALGAGKKAAPKGK